MFEVGDEVLCYHAPIDREHYIDDKAFYDGEQGIIRFVSSRGHLRYGVEFIESNFRRHDLTSSETPNGLCELYHGYWMNEENLVLAEEECKEVDETSLMNILKGDEMHV